MAFGIAPQGRCTGDFRVGRIAAGIDDAHRQGTHAAPLVLGQCMEALHGTVDLAGIAAEQLPGLGLAMNQGDSYVLEIARMLGLQVTHERDDVTVERATGSLLRAVNVILSDASDLVPAVAVACTAIAGQSSITGVGFIRAKESDRLGDLAHELNDAGGDVVVDEDGLTIHGGRAITPRRPLGTHHDHRLAMAFSLLAVGGAAVDIDEPNVVSKSWPTYFSDMADVIGPVDGLH